MSEPIGAVEKNQTEKRKVRDRTTGAYVTKLTDELRDLVTTAIKAGASITTAAQYAGITQATLRKWLNEGRNALNQAPSIEEVEERFRPQAVFVQAMEDAIASFKIDLTGSLLQHGRESWQAHAWLLERKFPDEFGRRQRVDHGNADGQPFQVAPTPMFDPSKLTTEELDEAIRLLEKAQPDSMRARPQLPSGELRVIDQDG